MAGNTAPGDVTPPEPVNNGSVNKDESAKPLPMSFADWKKIKEAKEQPDTQANLSSRKTLKNDNKFQGGSRYPSNSNTHSTNNNSNMNNSFPPLSRPPPLPFPLVSMGFGNIGSGPCGPPPMLGSACMGNMGPGPGPGPRSHRPLKPPPFWEDMISPQHRPPPIQPPMPKCPSSWNLLPKEKQTNQRRYKRNNNQNNQPNKKYKTNVNKTNSNSTTNVNNNNATKDALLDAALMPPPPPPGDNSNNSSCSPSNSSTSNKVVKKKKGGGTFVQIDGKWIQRPEAPPPLEDAPPGTKEDRQRQWREYRQAMKPFKNREFHNWKRTVQRLSKLPRDQLDEKQLLRLQKAEEYIGAHKAMLTIKHAEQWVQQNNQKTEGAGRPQGQVYVRKPAHTAWHKVNDQNAFQRGIVPNHKQTFGTGRAIKGGLGCDVGNMPNGNPTGPAMGHLSELSGPQLNCGYFGYNSNPYAPNICGNSNTNIVGNGGNNSGVSSFYGNYTSSFAKAGTLLPP